MITQHDLFGAHVEVGDAQKVYGYDVGRGEFVEVDEAPFSTIQHETVFGEAALDYITLSTFNRDAFGVVFSSVYDADFEQDDRFRGYVGKRVGPYRMVTGEQAGKWHGLIIVEGSNAQTMVDYMVENTYGDTGMSLINWFSCTRLDVQISVPDTGMHFRKLKDDLKNPLTSWQRRGARPKIQLIEGERTSRGLGNTLYVGSRRTKHGHFVRIYQKANGDTPYLRFEVQYKRKRAQEVLTQYITQEDVTKETLVATALSAFPADILQGHLKGFVDGLAGAGTVEFSQTEVENKDVKRASWFKYHVLPAMFKIESEHMRKWVLKELLKAAFVTQNMIAREKRIKEHSETLALLNEADRILTEEDLKALRLQDDITADLIMAESDDEDAGIFSYEQSSFWSLDMFERMVNTVYESPYHDYR